MVSDTFAHPYITQVIALGLSFLPTFSIIVLIGLAAALGDRSAGRPTLTLRGTLPGA